MGIRQKNTIDFISVSRTQLIEMILPGKNISSVFQHGPG